MLKTSLSLTLLAALLAGCGSTSDSPGSAGLTIPASGISRPDTDLLRIQAAMVNDPATAVQLAPTRHLNGNLVKKSVLPTTVTVAQLEMDYDTLFGGLSEALSVTNSTAQVQSNIAFIASQPATGYFDLSKAPIQNNPLGVTGVAVRSVDYVTTVPLPAGDKQFIVSGGLLLPQGLSKSQIKGVIVYFHGTGYNKSHVPSDYSACIEAQLMAQVFASQGYIVVMPDYVGLGVDWADVQPYQLYPQAQAKCAVDMLSSVQFTIASEYGLSAADGPLKLFSTGYAEGGAYALWFNGYVSSKPGLQATNFYKLTHSVGMEGPYSCSDITNSFLFDFVQLTGLNSFKIQDQTLTNIVKALAAANSFMAYTTYSLAGDFASVFNTDFFNMQASRLVNQSDCNVGGRQLSIAQAFALPASNIARPLLYSAFYKSTNVFTYPGGVVEVAESQFNSVWALASATLYKLVGKNQLEAVQQAADVNLSSVPDQSVSIISLDQDSVVTPNHFDWLLSAYPTKIKNSIKIDHTKLQVVSPFSPELGHAAFLPVDNLQALTYEFLYTLNILNSY